ncbi:hypothetical protein JCM8547_004428 [Rhodosporidiobolus lusitaniae]
MESDDEGPAASVSSLRARFEGLGAAGSSPSPTPSPGPKPAGLVRAHTVAKPPPASKPVTLRRSGTVVGAGQAEKELAKTDEVGGSAVEGMERSLTEPPARPDEASLRPARPAVPSRPPSIVVAAFSPLLPPPPYFPSDLPSPTTPDAPRPPPSDSPDPFQSPEPPAKPPTPPTATRPSLSSAPSLRRPAPPPPSSRGRASSATTIPPPDAAPAPATVPALPNMQARLPTPPLPPPAPSPSPGLSVRNLALRLHEPSPLSRTPSSTSSLVRLPSPLVSEEETMEPFGEEEKREAGNAHFPPVLKDEAKEDSEEGSIYSSSPEHSPAPKPRPVIPPRPAASQLSREPSRSELPPPLPSRSSTTSSTASTGSPALPLPTGSPLPLPPRRDVPLVASPSPIGAPPALPARNSSIPPISLPPRPSPSAPPASLPAPISIPYIPPPPPTRSAASGSVAPVRPGVVPNGDGSSDEDEDDVAQNKAQEFPDATFANRRPPVLRNRRVISSQNGFSAFAVRAQRVVTAHHRLHLWHPSVSSTAESLPVANDQEKFLSVEFRAASDASPEDDGRYIWCGTKEGNLYEFDLEHHVVTQTRQNVHAAPLSYIWRVGKSMITLDESGKMTFWGSSIDNDGVAPDLSSGPYKQNRVPDKQTWAGMVGDELWTSSGPLTKPGSSAVSMRSPQIRVFDPSGARGSAFALLSRPLVTPESAGQIGAVTAHAIVPHQDHLVFLGHDNGYVSVWERATYACVLVQRISPYSISALAGVRGNLWAGFRTGNINVLSVSSEPWTVKKAWKAHKDPVVRLMVDPASLWKDETLQVTSASSDTVCIWDGFLRDDWLDHELSLRQTDFSTFRTIRALSISWNCDSRRPADLHGTPENLEFLQQAITSVENPDIISFGFQEIIDLEDKKLTAKSILLGKKKTVDQLSDHLSSAYRQWHDRLVQAVRLAMPASCPYTVIHAGDLIGLFSCVFVKSSEVGRLRDVALTTVKTGFSGRLGNKGAILSRFVIDDSSICFINCHLAAGQSHRRQRDADLVQILEGEKSNFGDLVSSSPGAYAPGGSGSLVADHELTVLSGDLNYRIDARRDVVVSAVASGNCESLLQHDQLLKNMANNQTFRLRSFKEPPIHFPPTYKYDPGTDNYDSSSKKRIPAWCDRILYRADVGGDRKITPLHYRRWEVNVSDHRPVSAAFEMRIKSVLPEKRALVWGEVEAAWFKVEGSVLEETRRYYADK